MERSCWGWAASRDLPQLRLRPEEGGEERWGRVGAPTGVCVLPRAPGLRSPALLAPSVGEAAARGQRRAPGAPVGLAI